MIVQCPDCTTRYQLDPQRVPRERIRVRCPKCRYVFPVDGTLADREALNSSGVSAGVSAPVPPTPAQESGPTPDPTFASDRWSGSVPSAPALERDPIISDDQPGIPAAGTDTPSPWDDGPPAPPEEGFDTPVEAPASTPEPLAADTPAAAPGFDLEIEHHGTPAPTPDPVSAAAPTVEPESSVATADEPEAVEAPTESPARPAPTADVPPAQKKARRLARALVSDILVYNRETRDKALAEGTLVQALGHEIKKSAELYRERVGNEVEQPMALFAEALNDILADGQKVF